MMVQNSRCDHLLVSWWVAVVCVCVCVCRVPESKSFPGEVMGCEGDLVLVPVWFLVWFENSRWDDGTLTSTGNYQ